MPTPIPCPHCGAELGQPHTCHLASLSPPPEPVQGDTSDETLAIWASGRFTDAVGAHLARELQAARIKVQQLTARLSAMEQERDELRQRWTDVEVEALKQQATRAAFEAGLNRQTMWSAGERWVRLDGGEWVAIDEAFAAYQQQSEKKT
jgi:hypothetical protein